MNSKKIILGAAIVLVIGLGGWFWQTKSSAINLRALSNDESEITVVESGLVSSDEDRAVAVELEQTLTDVADNEGSSNAFDDSAINSEEAEINASQELNASTDDAAILQEIDATAGEISQ